MQTVGLSRFANNWEHLCQLLNPETPESRLGTRDLLPIIGYRYIYKGSDVVKAFKNVCHICACFLTLTSGAMWFMTAHAQTAILQSPATVDIRSLLLATAQTNEWAALAAAGAGFALFLSLVTHDF